jgi:chorismate synthase
MSHFRFVTAGESHGKGLITIVEGMVADLAITEDYIANDLKRRQLGYGRGPRMNIEKDFAEIISGVRHGYTIGSPISLLIKNKDWDNWQDVMDVNNPDKKGDPISLPRPGHADLVGLIKFGLKDIRSVLERASARETVARVAAGAIARRFLQEFGVIIQSHTVSIGNCRVPDDVVIDWQCIEKSPLRCSDQETEKMMVKVIDKAKEDGDTLGGVFELVASGVPVGLGSHAQWNQRLDGQIAMAIMSIPSVKGIEFGNGFKLAEALGSKSHDEILPNTMAGKPFWARPTNRAGGIEGGISNGEPLIIRAAMKPIATLKNSLSSIDLKTRKTSKAHYERSDVCVVPSGGVIGEAMLAIVLADAILGKFGGDNLKETLSNYNNYIRSIDL